MEWQLRGAERPRSRDVGGGQRSRSALAGRRRRAAGREAAAPCPGAGSLTRATSVLTSVRERCSVLAVRLSLGAEPGIAVAATTLGLRKTGETHAEAR
jgi:hypothetical protein